MTLVIQQTRAHIYLLAARKTCQTRFYRSPCLLMAAVLFAVIIPIVLHLFLTCIDPTHIVMYMYIYTYVRCMCVCVFVFTGNKKLRRKFTQMN